LAEIQSDSNLEAIKRPSLNVGYLALKLRAALETRVRRSPKPLTNKRLSKRSGASWVKATHFIPPHQEFQSNTVADYQYNRSRQSSFGLKLATQMALTFSFVYAG